MIFRSLLLRSLWVSVVVVPLLALAATAPPGSGRVPEWKAGEIVAGADLVAIVEGPSDVYPWVSVPELFGREEEAPVYSFVVAETVFGDVSEGEEIVMIQPAGFDHRSAALTKGRSLLFLRRLDAEAVEHIRNHMMPWGAKKLPDEIWGFVEHEYGWMNWVQLRTEKDGEEVVNLRSPIVSQLNQHAGIERAEQDIKSYIKELLNLRQSVLDNGAPPDTESFDYYQKAVVQHAIDERPRLEGNGN